MTKWVERPNLPLFKVRYVLLGKKYSLLSNILSNLGINIIHVPDNYDVNPALAGHADLSALHLGGRRILVSRSIGHFASELNVLGFEAELSGRPCSAAYPGDVGLNACLIKNKLFCAAKYADEKLLVFAEEKGLEIISVKQGYAKCSICVVDESHIITEDKSVHKAAEACGVESLLISPGHVALEGFGYGFIGGATGKLGKSALAFTGTLKRHPDEDKILRFLEACAVEPVYLTDRPCFDVGSILPVIEEDSGS